MSAHPKTLGTGLFLTAAATTWPGEAAPVPITDTAYDDLDRPFRTTQYLPAVDGGNRVTESGYNLDDSVQAVNKAVGTAQAQAYATYSYTPNGQVDSVKDAKNNLTVHTYDGFDRLARTYYPLPNTPLYGNANDYEENTYDANGNITSMRRRDGQTVTQSWDNLNRLSTRSYPNGSNYQRLNPQGHPNNPTPHGHGHLPGTGPGMRGQGPSLDPTGNVVPWNSPDAHWPIR